MPFVPAAGVGDGGVEAFDFRRFVGGGDVDDRNGEAVAGGLRWGGQVDVDFIGRFCIFSRAGGYNKTPRDVSIFAAPSVDGAAVALG